MSDVTNQRNPSLKHSMGAHLDAREERAALAGDARGLHVRRQQREVRVHKRRLMRKWPLAFTIAKFYFYC